MPGRSGGIASEHGLCLCCGRGGGGAWTWFYAVCHYSHSQNSAQLTNSSFPPSKVTQYNSDDGDLPITLYQGYSHFKLVGLRVE